MRLAPLNMFKHYSDFYWPFQGDASFVYPFCYLYFTFKFFFIILNCLFLASWERADLLALSCVMCDVSLCFCHFPI